MLYSMQEIEVRGRKTSSYVPTERLTYNRYIRLLNMVLEGQIVLTDMQVGVRRYLLIYPTVEKSRGRSPTIFDIKA
jgi:hypothetical protein